MASVVQDRTTVAPEPWKLFADIANAMILVLVLFLFVQFVANSRVLATLLMVQKQNETAQILMEQLGDDAIYLTIVNDGNLQRLRFSSAILFGTGEDALQPEGRRVLSSLGTALIRARDAYVAVMIEGHTDDRPISTRRFPSNWELSSARATAVVRFLEDDVGIDPAIYHVSSVGRSEYVPVDSAPLVSMARPTALDEWRDLNRRIEVILVYSEKGLLEW